MYHVLNDLQLITSHLQSQERNEFEPILFISYTNLIYLFDILLFIEIYAYIIHTYNIHYTCIIHTQEEFNVQRAFARSIRFTCSRCLWCSNQYAFGLQEQCFLYPKRHALASQKECFDTLKGMLLACKRHALDLPEACS